MFAVYCERTGARNVAVASRLRFCYAGGSPLDPVLKRAVERMFGLPLHNGYGLTESGPTVSQTRLDAPRDDSQTMGEDSEPDLG